MATETATDQTEVIQTEPVQDAAPTGMDRVKDIFNKAHGYTKPEEDREQPEGDPGDADLKGEEPTETVEEFPAELYKTAAAIGLTRENARALGKDEVERLAHQWTREPQPSPEPAAEKPSGFKFELPEDVDPGIRKAFESMHKHYEDRLAEYGEVPTRLKALEEFYQNTQRQQQEQWADSKFASLGDEYVELIGKGSTRSIKDEKVRSNRVAVLEEIGVYVAGLQAQGKPLPDPDVLFERAVNSVFGPKQSLIARKQVETRLRDKSGQFLSKPRGSTGPEQASGRERAAQIFAEARSR